MKSISLAMAAICPVLGMAAIEGETAKVAVDFGEVVGKVRPELHSSGFGAKVCSCSKEMLDDVRSLHFKAARTHDWSLTNPNQRVCDWHMIFPLVHLDAKDPNNYYFAATDYLLKRNREELGLDIFYRLGTSIEHSGPKVHFNTLIPEDFDKVAEVFAGTVRHYNRGWANGYHWNIKNWEIWNEPDGQNTMWCLPDGDGPRGTNEVEKAEYNRRFKIRQAAFVKFFVTCLKRLKAEFGDSINVGGPAMCYMYQDYFAEIFKACKEAGVEPDFISWHNYSEKVDSFIGSIDDGRKLCDKYGFTKCKLIINEWHYFGYHRYDWKNLRSQNPAEKMIAWTSPASHNGIDSSCYTLACLTKFQTSALDEAFYYGCRHSGSWGYMDELSRKYKVYYGLKLFGELMVDGCEQICKAEELNPEGLPILTSFAIKSTDGAKAELLISDFRTGVKTVEVEVKGLPAGLKPVKVVRHDFHRDLNEVPFTFEGGKLVLDKVDRGSAAFRVTFAR